MTRPAPAKPGRKPARILPTLAILFLGASALRLVAGVDAALAQDPAQDPAQHRAAAPASPEPVALRTSPESDAELSLEIRRREREVEHRESALAEREAILLALESRVQDQVAALETAEAELTATMALADRAAEDDILRLVGVFEVMKPEDAAALFAEMEPGFAAGFLARLTPTTAAAILSGLAPRQAYALSALIAGRNALVPRE